MRTTINLPDDVHQIARLYAEERNLTLGEAIGELVRSDFWKNMKFLSTRPGKPQVAPEQIYRMLDKEY